LQTRLRASKPGSAQQQLARLRKRQERQERLTDLYSWGDLSDADYRQKRYETEAEIAGVLSDMPDDNMLVSFDAHKAVAASLPEAMHRQGGKRPRRDSNSRRRP
jgi:hypothetical protein